MHVILAATASVSLAFYSSCIFVYKIQSRQVSSVHPTPDDQSMVHRYKPSCGSTGFLSLTDEQMMMMIWSIRTLTSGITEFCISLPNYGSCKMNNSVRSPGQYLELQWNRPPQLTIFQSTTGCRDFSDIFYQTDRLIVYHFFNFINVWCSFFFSKNERCKRNLKQIRYLNKKVNIAETCDVSCCTQHFSFSQSFFPVSLGETGSVTHFKYFTA